jgi:hypothetical protein
LFDHPNKLKLFYSLACYISLRNTTYGPKQMLLPQPSVLKLETPGGIIFGSENDLVHCFTVCNEMDDYFILEIVDNFNQIVVICKY